MKRRTLLLSSSAIALARVHGEELASPAATLVDCQLYIGDHPRRDLPQFTPSSWAALGLKQGWVGHFGAFSSEANHQALNAELRQRCADLPGSVAAQSLDLSQQTWRRDLEAALAATARSKALLRLCPSLHGYDWKHPALGELLTLCSQRSLPVQVVAKFEDARTQRQDRPLPPLSLREVPTICERLPQLRLMLLNINATEAQVQLRGCRNLWLDSAMIEGAAGLAGLLGHWPKDRLCLGSYAPFFYAAALPLKLQEAGLPRLDHQALAHQNASAFLG